MQLLFYTITDFTSDNRPVGTKLCKGESLQECPICGRLANMREFPEYITYTHIIISKYYVPVDWDFCRITKEDDAIGPP